MALPCWVVLVEIPRRMQIHGLTSLRRFVFWSETVGDKTRCESIAVSPFARQTMAFAIVWFFFWGCDVTSRAAMRHDAARSWVRRFTLSDARNSVVALGGEIARRCVHRCVLYSAVAGKPVEDKSLEQTIRSGTPREEDHMMYLGPSMSIARRFGGFLGKCGRGFVRVYIREDSCVCTYVQHTHSGFVQRRLQSLRDRSRRAPSCLRRQADETQTGTEKGKESARWSCFLPVRRKKLFVCLGIQASFYISRSRRGLFLDGVLASWVFGRRVVFCSAAADLGASTRSRDCS